MASIGTMVRRRMARRASQIDAGRNWAPMKIVNTHAKVCGARIDTGGWITAPNMRVPLSVDTGYTMTGALKSVKMRA
jgi:hypothetical protein